MSNPLFENPKIALGFAGVVVAIALVASVALKEFSPSDEAEAAPVVAEQAPAAPAAPQQPAGGFASNAASGWGDDGGAANDWGAPSAAAQTGGFAEVPEATNDAPVFGDHRSKSLANGAPDRSSGPTITSRAAPGAPEVRPPGSNGPQPQIVAQGG